eukprot:763495-Hanusia_phi.AAC.1
MTGQGRDLPHALPESRSHTVPHRLVFAPADGSEMACDRRSFRACKLRLSLSLVLLHSPLSLLRLLSHSPDAPTALSSAPQLPPP